MAFAQMGSLLADAAPARTPEVRPQEQPLPPSSPLGPGAHPRPPTPAASGEAGGGPASLQYQAARREVARALEMASAGKPFDGEPLQRVAMGLVEATAAGDGLLVQALEDGETHLDLPRHLLNVAILAVKIGQGIGYGEAELARLALAAALHDVGMTSIPRPILEKPGALSPEELALIRQHPEQGFRMLQVLGPPFEWVATVALQHHEREDGSGYPQGLTGEQIHEYAKIVGLADVYESLSHTRLCHGRGRPFDVVERIREIVRRNRHTFPPRMLKGLLEGVSPFPVGSLVRLNSLEIARVVANNPASPLRPVVEVITGPKGERLAAARRVDLAQNALLYIMDAASGEADSRGPSHALPAEDASGFMGRMPH